MIQINQQPKRGEMRRISEKLAISMVNWFRCNGRNFPWQNTTNLFYIPVAHVLLRQPQTTRVVTTYNHLVTTDPNPASLTEAIVNGSRKWFEHLGLVRRVDRLAKSAHRVLRNYKGNLPLDLPVLQSLSGFKCFSAQAILCVAFNYPPPMIDQGSGQVLWRDLQAAEKRGRLG